jgi:ABC-type bacteriocin/lantibiotic exporter with double-glycine peptidase domain
MQKADEKIAGYLHYRTEHFKVLLLQYKTLIGFKTLVTAAMLIVGTLLMINQQLTVGQFIAAEIVILTVLTSVEKLIVNLDSVYDVLTAVEKIEQVPDKESEQQGTLLFNPQQNKGIEVKIQHLSFGYTRTDKVVNNISAVVAPGEKVCIKGKDGSGKSTLLRLLTGMYDGYEGSILLNGIPLKNYNLQQLRQHIGVMISQQDIFEGTLLENITMGLQNPDMEELIYLCKKTGLNDFIATLKDGFDTPLYTNGRKLPATVVRKILLVRALINKPSLLLLEEPWRGLEAKYQQQIKELLLKEMPGTTAFIISSEEEVAIACDKTINM